MMDIEKREERFNKLCSRFSCKQLGRLVSDYRIPPQQFASLKTATMFYMSRCLPQQEIILDEDTLLETFSDQLDSMTNITPNGKIKPKPHLILDYNMVIRSFADIIDSLNINDLICGVRAPSLRYKASISDESLARPYASEKPHLDAWRGHPEN